MKPKFQVTLDIEEGSHPDYGEYTYLAKVTPVSLSLLCPYCGVYSTMRLEASVPRPNWRFDLICTCAHCEKSVFVQAEYIASGSKDGSFAPGDSTAVISISPQSRKVDVNSEVPEKYSNDYRESILVLDLMQVQSGCASKFWVGWR